ncbi:MAG: PEGA domain-containing protein [Phycisphaeraceae bacterium]
MPVPFAHARVVLVGLLLLAVTGCARRTIEITSDPPGALVHLNDEQVGRTPLDVPFTFYGVYDVRLDLAGHEPIWARRRARAPWWEHPGPDLLGEALGLHARLHWHFDLSVAVAPDDVDADALEARARALREQIR